MFMSLPSMVEDDQILSSSYKCLRCVLSYHYLYLCVWSGLPVCERACVVERVVCVSCFSLVAWLSSRVIHPLVCRQCRASGFCAFSLNNSLMSQLTIPVTSTLLDELFQQFFWHDSRS